MARQLGRQNFFEKLIHLNGVTDVEVNEGQADDSKNDHVNEPAEANTELNSGSKQLNGTVFGGSQSLTQPMQR